MHVEMDFAYELRWRAPVRRRRKMLMLSNMAHLTPMISGIVQLVVEVFPLVFALTLVSYDIKCSGLPPVFSISGGREVLIDDIRVRSHISFVRLIFLVPPSTML